MKKLFHHYFFPQATNNFKARLLHSIPITWYIILLLLFQTTFGFVKRVQPAILGYATDITIEKVLFLVNQEREKAHLSPLILSPELSTAATSKAGDMFSKNYWAHISPTGITPWDFITSSGYTYVYAGENLAKSFDTSQEVIEAWMDSPTHRANILKPEYVDIGLAIMNGKLQGEETTLIVQEFGTRKDHSLAMGKPKEREIATLITSSTHEKLPFLRSLPKNTGLILIEFLLVILFFDSIYIWKTKTIRTSGNSLAHIIFLISLIGAMGATGIGVIL